MHVNEDALILHYYGEGDDPSVESHLESCPTCRLEFVKLSRVLAMVDEQPVPDPSPGFERQMWARIQPMLEQQPRGWLSRFLPSGSTSTSKWALAGGLAALVLAAFVAGRFTSPTVPVTPATEPAVADVGDRVLLVAVVDHLDRSQMVLVELLNGDVDGLSNIGSEQSRARELVAANRLYRQTAVQAGDSVIGETLEDLERVLLEIANAPEDVTAEDVAALREQIGARGLLFRVRVVQSEIRERERVNQQNRVAG
jgi:hypothetical protein